jgi:transcriptional regulator with XRE-family HTH domain
MNFTYPERLTVMEKVTTLRDARAAQMLTVRALAAAAGCSPNTVHLVETGQRVPQFETIRKLSDVLGVQPGQIAEFRAALRLPVAEDER